MNQHQPGSGRKPNAFLLTVFLFLVFPLMPKSQGIVNVNNLTGTANVTIPIYSVSVGDISAPVALTYNASGLKVEDYNNSLGMGWRLIAQSSITRIVRGFPDDVQYQTDASFSTIKGWLRSGNVAPQTIQSTAFQNIANPSTCSNEISDATTIANNYGYMYDTEPDYFSVNAPGLSCDFVFDGTTNHAIKMIPYRDYKITYAADGLGRIISFTVINDNGVKYIFDLATFTERSIGVYNPGTTVAIDPATLEVFKREFLMYRTPGYPDPTPIIKYNDQWMLTKMVDPRGNEIRFSYGNPYYSNNPVIQQKLSYKPVEILKPNGSGGFTKKMLYGVTTTAAQYHIQSISTFSLGLEAGSFQTEVQFNWATPASGTNEDQRVESINLPRETKKYYLLYTRKFLGQTTPWYQYGRYFLKGLKLTTTSGVCDNVYSQFDFSYYEVNEANNSCYCTPINPNSNPPVTVDTIINAQDYWGYYNGKFLNPNLNPQIYAYPDNPTVELFKVYNSISGISPVTLTETADRNVNPNVIHYGTLKKITYPTGATTELEYESNEFFDSDVNGNVLGGGIRIKKITSNDGLNNLDITNYGYNDPVFTAKTTGRAIAVPKYTIAFRNNSTYSTSADRIYNSTYRTTYDLNDEPKDILYGKVTVSKGDPNLGKSIFEYNTTGTFRSSAVTDWSESINSVSRTDLSGPTPCYAITPNFLVNGASMYPFASNPNFDFERGLPQKVTHYNGAGQVVASEDYTYARSHTNPTIIWGVKLDDLGNTAVSYSRYPINATVDNFMVTKLSKLYNSNSANPIEETETFEYTLPGATEPYRLLKKLKKQNSGDPAVTVTSFKYSKEYTASTPFGTPTTEGQLMNEALYNFNTDNGNSNYNRNVVVETVQYKDLGGTATYLGGTLTTFRKITVGDIVNGGPTVTSFLPYRTYNFAKPSGTTSFNFSTVTSGVFSWDGAYEPNPQPEFEQYNTRGVPQVVSDISRIPRTILSYPSVKGLSVAEFTNARVENVGFTNSEADYPANFSLGGNTVITTEGRHSNKCVNFQPNTTICRTLTKSATAKNLIVSFWLKDASSSGSIYICFNKFGGVCGTFTCNTSTTSISFTASSEWKYYQIKIPWGSATYSTLSYSLGTSTAVKIDDILIYPDNANVTTYSYTTSSIGINLLTAKTGINGIGESYEYDKAGRLWITRDQYGNILEMKKYKMVNRYLDQIPTFWIGYPHYTPLNSQPVTLTAGLPMAYETGDCDAPQITYNWDFGDGTTGVSYGSGSRGETSIQHTYPQVRKYQVTVTASSPGMSNVVVQTPPITNNPPDPHPLEIVSATPSCSPGGTPQICASGIKKYTSTGQCILESCATTPALPYTCNDTYFKLTGLSSGDLTSVSTVEWEINYPALGTSWYSYQPAMSGTAGYITSYHFHIGHTITYRMRAKIKYCDNSIAYSNAIEVVNEN